MTLAAGWGYAQDWQCAAFSAALGHLTTAVPGLRRLSVGKHHCTKYLSRKQSHFTTFTRGVKSHTHGLAELATAAAVAYANLQICDCHDYVSHGPINHVASLSPRVEVSTMCLGAASDPFKACIASVAQLSPAQDTQHHQCMTLLGVVKLCQ